jgi:hypothetical protein
MLTKRERGRGLNRSGPAAQLKRYAFRPEAMEDFLAVWRDIVRVRKANGFSIPFAALDRESHILTWAISHPDFAGGAERYYADPARKGISPTDYNPATGIYSDDPSRAGQGNIEDYIGTADISWVELAPIP